MRDDFVRLVSPSNKEAFLVVKLSSKRFARLWKLFALLLRER